jgi:hypothetical protein
LRQKGNELFDNVKKMNRSHAIAIGLGTVSAVCLAPAIVGGAVGGAVGAVIGGVAVGAFAALCPATASKYGIESWKKGLEKGAKAGFVAGGLTGALAAEAALAAAAPIAPAIVLPIFLVGVTLAIGAKFMWAAAEKQKEEAKMDNIMAAAKNLEYSEDESDTGTPSDSELTPSEIAEELLEDFVPASSDDERSDLSATKVGVVSSRILREIDDSSQTTTDEEFGDDDELLKEIEDENLFGSGNSVIDEDGKTKNKPSRRERIQKSSQGDKLDTDL